MALISAIPGSAINRHNRQLFDLLVGAQQNRWRYRKDRALGGATKGVCVVDSVGEQAAVCGKGRCVIDRRYVVLGRRQYDRQAMRVHECTRQRYKAASRLTPEGGDGRFDLCVAVNGRNDWRDFE